MFVYQKLLMNVIFRIQRNISEYDLLIHCLYRNGMTTKKWTIKYADRYKNGSIQHVYICFLW